MKDKFVEISVGIININHISLLTKYKQDYQVFLKNDKIPLTISEQDYNKLKKYLK